MESFFLDPFQSEAVRTGGLAVVAVGVLCAVVGCYVVLRGMALMADSLAHGVLPGVAVVLLIAGGGEDADPTSLAITAGALVAGLITAGATALILRRSRLREETAVAVVFVFMLALGVVLISRAGSEEHDLDSFLFGDVLGVGHGELAVAAIASIVLLALIVLLRRPFLLLSFDRERAAALGLPVDRLHLAMLLIVTAAVVLGFRVVGALLVLGLLLAPPAAAALVTHRLPAMMVVSAAIAALSAPVGIVVADHLDLELAATIVLVPVTVFVAALALRPAPG